MRFWWRAPRCLHGQEAITGLVVYLEAHTLPLCLGYLVLWLGSVILKSRRPKNGVEYEPIGSASGFRV